MMWFTEQFCSKCGRQGQAVEAGEMLNMNCPRCAVQLRSVAFDHATAGECPTCTGLWIAPTDFEHICHDADQRAVDNGSVLPTAPVPPRPMTSTRAEPGPGGVAGGGSMYPPCAVCRQPMAHQNFAQRSGVRINRCRQHGVWLDKGELRTIVDFIRAGGLVLTRAIETENLKRARRDLAQQQRAGEDHSEPPSMWERLFWL
jgi:Zn-finger nucleic acid-binding protein